MFLLGLGFVAMIGLFSAILVATRSPVDDAQLATQARQVQNYIESENLGYIQCGTAATYDAAVQTARSSGALLLPSSTTVHVISVDQSTGGTHTAAGVPSVPVGPINGCVGGSADYGVQQLELKLTTSSIPTHSLERIVYKRWN
jgi:hypothetical protein